MTIDTFRLGRWRRSTSSRNYKIAEGPVIFGPLEITCTLHRKESVHWLVFPNRTVWRDRSGLHRLIAAAVRRLQLEQPELFQSTTPAARTELQGRLQQRLVPFKGQQ
jgi:hypothetical protein